MVAVIVTLGVIGLLAISIAIYMHTPMHKEKVNKKKGQQGEKLVAKKLGKNKKGSHYAINDFYIFLNNRSVQIDHIYICNKGVFVLETKNFSGEIYGQENSQNWTQVLGNGDIKNEHRNPLLQNKTHVYAIDNLVPKYCPLYSLVVMVQNNGANIKSSYVVDLNDLLKVINKCPVALTPEQINRIYNKLSHANMKDQISEKDHIKDIRKMQKDLDNNICPRCGHPLVLRHSPYGDFLGCSNYPKCKFTKKL